MTLFLLSDNETKLAINTKIKNYEKYKNFVFLKLFENKKIDRYIKVDLLIKDLKKFNLFDEFLDIIFQYLYDHFFSTKGKLLCLLKYDKIKDIFLFFTKLNFSNYIYDFKLNLKVHHNICSINNNYEIASKLELLRAKIFDEEVIDKLEENYGIYLDSANFIEELKSKRKIRDRAKIKFLKNSVFNPIIKINSYYSMYKKCNKRLSSIWNNYEFDSLYNFNSFRNNFEESLYKEIIDLFYTYKKKKINKIKEIKINEKEKIKRDKIITKNNYDKINNARLNKYINKKNITRLLLCKRNHY